MVIITKVCTKTAILMAMVSIYGKMDLSIKVISWKGWEKGKEHGVIRGEMPIKASSKETRKMEKEFSLGQTETFIKVNLWMIWEKDREKWFGAMGAIIKEIGRKAHLMV